MSVERIRETRRTWFAGIAVTLTTIISYMAFWRLSPIVTLVIGCVALICLVFTAWWYGRRLRLDREKAKELQSQSDHGVSRATRHQP